jgi:hypothetical protein
MRRAKISSMIVTELYTRDIPEIYDRFSRVIGEKHWRQRVSLLRQELRGNRFLEHLFLSENAIAFQLEHLAQLRDRYGTVPLMACNDRNIYQAVSFAAQVLSVIERSERTFAERVRRRVHGAFKNPADLRAMRLELGAATHFLRRGYKVSWPELTDTGTFDLLVEDIGPSGLEVECKAFSEDMGRKVTRRQALDFFGLLSSQHGHTLRAQSGGIAATVTVSQRLPTNYKERKALAAHLARCVETRSSGALGETANVRIEEFDTARLNGIVRGESIAEVRGLLDDITGTRNREVMVVGRRSGALALALQGSADDTLLDSMFATLRDSASRQFSGSRGAMFMAGIEGIDASQLLDVAGQDQDPSQPPTGLRWGVSRFLGSNGRDHVVGVGFLSDSAMRPVSDDLVDAGGTAYYFPKRESPFWSEDFSGLFDWQGAAADAHS